ncbi:phage tail tube protein [Microvirga antarctica]|uniref:phage tail tube protein n=1 Tax=Microvirga antarctica TaxID=2819233 RepID=UPI001B308D90|nr:phage tail tube protein [Microvirga antarctica]
MAITTATGTKIYIGPAVTDTTDTIPEFAALTPWVEITLVETYGEFGDESSAVTFAAVGDGRVRKAKGARDAGTLALTVGHDPLDVGQAAIDAAESTSNTYAFKVVLSDSPSDLYTDTVIYFRGLVMSKRKNVGGNDNVLRNTYNIGIDSPLHTIPSALI